MRNSTGRVPAPVDDSWITMEQPGQRRSFAEALRAGSISMHDIVDREYLAKLPEADHDWYRRNMALAREKHW